MLNFEFFKKGYQTSSSTTFWAYIFKKNVYHLCSIAIVFTSEDIRQYVYSNYIFPICDVIMVENNLSFLFKPFFYSSKDSLKKKLNILRKIYFFVTFKGLPVARDCHRPESVPSIHRIANHQIPIKQLGLKRDTFSF